MEKPKAGVDAALAGGQKGEEFAHFREVRAGIADGPHGAGEGAVGVIAVKRLTNRKNRTPRNAGALTTKRVVSLEAAIARGGKGRDIAGGDFVAGEDGEAADADELVDAHAACKEDVVTDGDVTGQEGGVGEDDVVTQAGVVTDVR